MMVDAHLHVLQSKNFDKDAWKKIGAHAPNDTKVEDLIRWLDDAGVAKGVLMGADFTRILNSRCGDDWVIRTVKEHPQKFIGLASLEPLDRHDRFNKQALEYLEEAITKHGLRGVFLSPPYGHYCANDRRVYPFYEKAVELEAVVQFHVTIEPDMPLSPLRYAQPSQIHDVSIDFPDMKIVIEHLGWLWTETLFGMMVQNRNIWTDLAEMYDRPALLARNLAMAKEYGVIDRIMYASDYWSWGHWPFSSDPGKDFLRYIDLIRNGVNRIAERAGWPVLTQAEIDGILGGNAQRLHDL